jgi:hypothetical protein
MRKKLIFILMISFAMTFSVTAQKKKVRFQSINEFGMVGGESQVNSAFQTINGIRFTNLFTGIGIGIDNYRYKTLPLFIEERWYFGDEKKAFIYGDIGYNFAMKNKPDKDLISYPLYHFSGGIYTDAGIGFQTKVTKQSSLLFSLGHSYKELQATTSLAPSCVNCSANSYVYKFSYGRMMLKAGFVF